MKESSKDSDQSTASRNDIPLRITRQQTQSARVIATKTISQSQTHMVSLGYLYDISQSLALLTILRQYQ